MKRWLTRQRVLMRGLKGLWTRWSYGGLTLVTCFVVTFGQYAHGALSPIEGAAAGMAVTSEVSIAETTRFETLIASGAQVSDYLDRGQALYDAGQYGAAIATWQQTLPLTPNTSSQRAIVHNYLAIGHQALSQWEQAATHIQQGLGLLENHQEAAFLTAQLLNTQGTLT